jgi:hypothetical protein
MQRIQWLTERMHGHPKRNVECTRDDISVQASMAWLQTAISMLKRHRILLIRYSMGIKSSFKKRYFCFAYLGHARQ